MLVPKDVLRRTLCLLILPPAAATSSRRKPLHRSLNPFLLHLVGSQPRMAHRI